ncbi:membrane protein [Beggiatoa sp. PS]|nr:membrane protein [Beggiatoa sp. PS]
MEMNSLQTKIEETQVRIFANYQMLSDWTWKSILQPFGLFSPPEPDIAAHLPDLTIKIDILLQEKQFVLQIIQTYILPLLYGLLGAYAYVLIQISKEIKTLVYMEESKVNYRLRLQLGALSGLAVGWFINPNVSALTDPSSIFIELSPLTLAFVAGYSVDVLFALMDRLIYTFSSNENMTSSLAQPMTRTRIDS